jgi:type IV secretion system protein VirD4
MNPHKRTFYASLPVLLGLLLGLWAATQYLVFKASAVTALGQPVHTIGDIAIYLPWSCVEWWLNWRDANPQLFSEAELFPVLGFVVGSFGANIVHRHLPPPPQDSDVHGSSRWANDDEKSDSPLVRKGPLSVDAHKKDGVIIGKTDSGDYLVDNEPTHILAFAPTRSGKGVGIVVPTLLNWQGSTVVLDIKGENWDLTAGWRNKFSHTLRFCPRDPESARYNPLLEIRPEADVADAQRLAEVLCDPDGKGDFDHWKLSAKDLLTGVILHVLYTEEDKSLARVADFLSSPQWSTPKEMYETMRTSNHTMGKPHRQIAAIAKSMENKPEKERSSIESTALSFLQLWRDPVIAENTRTSDFRASDLMNAEHPVSLYLDVPPNDLARIKPLLRLMLIQFCQRLTEDFGNATHRLLWMLDEFPTLGRLDFFEDALAFIAGAKMKACLISQNLQQFRKKYGSDNAIMPNCHTKITFAANDPDTAETVSKMLGKTTRSEKRVSYGGDYRALSKNSENLSYSHVGRALLTPGEITQLPPDEELVLQANRRPYRAKKVRYYEEKHFVRRTEHEVPPSRVPTGTFADSRPDPWTHKAPGTAADIIPDFQEDKVVRLHNRWKRD